MLKEIYQVKNKAKDVRKFHDTYTGKDVFVEPGKYVLTHTHLKDNEIWAVKLFLEKSNNKKQKGGERT
jgi:hypothetical protein